MSALAKALHQHHADMERLTLARDEAASKLGSYNEATERKAAELAEVEAAYAANAMSEALGLATDHDLPDSTKLEKLRADLAVAPTVRSKLVAKVQDVESSLSIESSKRKSMVSDWLYDKAVCPALDELESAFAALRNAAVKLMAAHRLCYHDYIDIDKRPPYRHANDIYGPAAQWIGLLRDMNWPEYPYEIRPDWLPLHGKFFSDELPGVTERIAELNATIEQLAG